MTESTPNRSTTPRGFDTYDHLSDSYGASVTIRQSSAASGPHVWLFIEGGGVTVSHFLRAGCLDRLQLTVAPVIMGSGRPSLTLPEIMDPASGLRPTVRRITLGDDTLFECIFGT